MIRYPSDEELNKWIQELEQEELYAPKHLKEKILAKASEPVKVKKQEEHSTSKKKSPQVSFFVYTAKIVAGMAAAILLTFVFPVNNGMDISRAMERMERMEEQADKREEKLIQNYMLPEKSGEAETERKSGLFSRIDNIATQFFEKTDKAKEFNCFRNKNQGGK